MSVVVWIVGLALLPVLVGGVAGRYVRPGEGYRQRDAVAWICTIGIVFVVLLIGFAATPNSKCGNTGCDTSYGVGAVFLSLPIFGLTLVGVALGRRTARRYRRI